MILKINNIIIFIIKILYYLKKNLIQSFFMTSLLICQSHFKNNFIVYTKEQYPYFTYLNLFSFEVPIVYPGSANPLT